MMAGRLRECLKALRWDAQDLEDVLFRERTEIEAWLDGRARVPLAVAAWLEALARAHQALPPPLPSSDAVEAADEVLSLANGKDCRRAPAAQGSYRRDISVGLPGVQRAPTTSPVWKG